MGAKLHAALIDRFGQHPNVGDIRGRGLFQGIEIVADRETKSPYAPERRVAARIKSAAFDSGLICYPMAGTRDGKHGDHILLAPPFILGDEQVSEMTDKLSGALVKATTFQ